MVPIRCPRCDKVVPPELANTGAMFRCPGCRRDIVLDVFPAYQQMRAAGPAAGVVVEGTATCFFHEERPAQVACDACGRLVCALCDVPVGREHLCPECLQLRNRRGKGERQTMPDARTSWDRLALWLALVPCIPVLIFFTLLTAPAALFVVFRYWRAPGPLVGWVRTRFVVAAVLASAQIVVWIAVFTEAWNP